MAMNILARHETTHDITTLTAYFNDDFAPHWVIVVTYYDDVGDVSGHDEWTYLDHATAVTMWRVVTG